MKLNYIWILLLAGALSFSCDDKWDDYYSNQDITVSGEENEATPLSVQEYLQSAGNYSKISSILKDSKVLETMNSKSLNYTLFVCPDDRLDLDQVTDQVLFANNSVCGLNISPSQFSEGFQILMWSNKYLNVKKKADDFYVSNSAASDGVKIEKVIKAVNGYIYVLENQLPPIQSLYDYLQNLGNDYSLFKDLILRYEEKVFDRENSVPLSVNASGNTIYDSVWLVQNTLMDRYNSGGTETWSMRNEYYNSTLFIIDNQTLRQALNNACDLVRISCGREPQASDTTKFEEWIVKAAFYSRIYTPEELNSEAEDLTSVSGYVKGGVSSTSGVKWKNSVQQLDVNNPVLLSNGISYKVTSFRIPNNVVIWRFKARFYDYDNCTPEQQAEWFKWENIDPETVSVQDRNNNEQFDPTGGIWPGLWYKNLEGSATEDAKNNLLKCALTYTACSADSEGNMLKMQVPAGEYYLRMGFHNGCKHLLNVYLNGTLVATRVQPSKAHFDRNGTGYPEGYDPKEYTDTKAANYDRDGIEIGVVTIKGEGLQDVVIRLESEDLAKVEDKFSFYNWTLRPTDNNY